MDMGFVGCEAYTIGDSLQEKKITTITNTKMQGHLSGLWKNKLL
jgi:hypothetical protein